MHNLYGNRKLNALEIEGAFVLSNGMFCEWGRTIDEGLAVDVYDDATKQLLIGLEHNIMALGEYAEKPTSESLGGFIDSFADELEDSMVYYYGPHDRPFEESELTKPVPRKTGRFAKRH